MKYVKLVFMFFMIIAMVFAYYNPSFSNNMNVYKKDFFFLYNKDYNVFVYNLKYIYDYLGHPEVEDGLIPLEKLSNNRLNLSKYANDFKKQKSDLYLSRKNYLYYKGLKLGVFLSGNLYLESSLINNLLFINDLNYWGARYNISGVDIYNLDNWNISFVIIEQKNKVNYYVVYIPKESIGMCCGAGDYYYLIKIAPTDAIKDKVKKDILMNAKTRVVFEKEINSQKLKDKQYREICNDSYLSVFYLKNAGYIYNIRLNNYIKELDESKFSLFYRSNYKYLVLEKYLGITNNNSTIATEPYFKITRNTDRFDFKISKDHYLSIVLADVLNNKFNKNKMFLLLDYYSDFGPLFSSDNANYKLNKIYLLKPKEESKKVFNNLSKLNIFGFNNDDFVKIKGTSAIVLVHTALSKMYLLVYDLDKSNKYFVYELEPFVYLCKDGKPLNFKCPSGFEAIPGFVNVSLNKPTYYRFDIENEALKVKRSVNKYYAYDSYKKGSVFDLVSYKPKENTYLYSFSNFKHKENLYNRAVVYNPFENKVTICKVSKNAKNVKYINGEYFIRYIKKTESLSNFWEYILKIMYNSLK